jgi:hypothetical protein
MIKFQLELPSARVRFSIKTLNCLGFINIYSDSDILLLLKGAVLSETLIGHLMNIEHNHKDKMLVSICFKH